MMTTAISGTATIIVGARWSPAAVTGGAAITTVSAIIEERAVTGRTASRRLSGCGHVADPHPQQTKIGKAVASLVPRRPSLRHERCCAAHAGASARSAMGLPSRQVMHRPTPNPAGALL